MPRKHSLSFVWIESWQPTADILFTYRQKKETHGPDTWIKTMSVKFHQCTIATSAYDDLVLRWLISYLEQIYRCVYNLFEKDAKTTSWEN